MSKHKLLAVMTFCLCMVIFMEKTMAQDKEVQTLFGNNNSKSKGYGFADAKLSLHEDYDPGFDLGVGYGWSLYKNTLSAGVAGYGILPTIKGRSISNDTVFPQIYQDYKNEKNYMSGGYGGVFVEYCLFPEKIVHFTANIFVGVGGVTYFSVGKNYNYKHPSSFLFLFEPRFGAELNLTKKLRMNLGVSYRLTQTSLKGLKHPEETKEGKYVFGRHAFRGFSINLAFKFGQISGNSTPKSIQTPENNSN